jgi:hypothetical protein
VTTVTAGKRSGAVGTRSRWLIVGAVLATGFAVVVSLSAWNTDLPAPSAQGAGTGLPPATQSPGTADGDEQDSMPGMEMPGSGSARGEESMAAMPPLAANADGLKTTAAGLTLVPKSTGLTAGGVTEWRFSIRDAAGRPVRRFERDQTKLLHLIVVRRDLTDYQHLHPTLGSEGEFSIPITVARPGTYRAIADFTTAGKRHVLGIDLTAPGNSGDRALPQSTDEVSVEGYRIALASRELKSGRDSQVTFSISRAGRPVGSLQPYLGARGTSLRCALGTSPTHTSIPRQTKGPKAQSASSPNCRRERPTAYSCSSRPRVAYGPRRLRSKHADYLAHLCEPSTAGRLTPVSEA